VFVSVYYFIMTAVLATVRTGHYVLLLSFLSSFFSDAIATKLSRMLGSDCNLRNCVRSLRALTLKFWGPKHENSDTILDNFPSLPDLTANDFGVEHDIVS